MECGAEGPTTDPEIERIRTRQVKNFLALNLLAIGTPMLLAGDEVRRTQQGNNNAYCQDNEISWFDWSLVEKHAGLLRFVKLLLAGRLDLHRESADSAATLMEILGSASVRWHGVEPNKADWGPHSHSLAATARVPHLGATLHWIVNAYWEPLDFELPPVPEGCQGPWRQWINTARESPHDICEWRSGVPITVARYEVQPRSTVILVVEK